MADDNVYGENVGRGGLDDERGVREETVEAHPQATGDDAAFTANAADAAADVKARGAEAVEGSEGVDADLDNARDRQAVETGGGGMGRSTAPRNHDGTPQGEFARDEDEGTTPG